MRKRAAFTLVEMLVSMALILFIMVILSQAFTTGLQVFRQLKGLGDMEERLRSTSQILRRDLAAYHFENYRKLSDPNFWSVGPPQQGFFRIWQGGASTNEGNDGDNFSYQASSHILHFTSKLSGQGQGDFASAGLPTSVLSTFPAALNLFNAGADNRYQQKDTQFRGRWYEVVYFMRPTGLKANGTGAALNTLYRRQLVVCDTAGVSNPSLASSLTSQSIIVGANGNPNNDWSNFAELACKKNQDILAVNPPVPGLYPDTVRFSSPADLTMPARRFAMLPSAGNASGAAPAAELAGLPANPFLSAAAAGLRSPPIQISSRTYPFLGEVPSAATSPWGLPPAALQPFFASPPPWQNNGLLQGADLMLPDVISFDVQVLVPGGGDFGDIPVSTNNSVLGRPTPAFPLAANIGVFDTWSNQNDGTYDYSSSTTASGTPVSVPQALNIIALKISIRIWDAKTLQARQVTIIQDM